MKPEADRAVQQASTALLHRVHALELLCAHLALQMLVPEERQEMAELASVCEVHDSI